MKAVNVDDVLKILHKYGRYIFVTDEKRYSSMVDEIANLKALEQEPVLDKIRAEITGKYRIVLKDTPKDDWSVKWNECIDEIIELIDNFSEKGEKE